MFDEGTFLFYQVLKYILDIRFDQEVFLLIEEASSKCLIRDVK